MKLTKTKALEETKRIWAELAETGSVYKSLIKESENYLSYCPCCEYLYQKTEEFPRKDRCLEFCPLVWPKQPEPENCVYSLQNSYDQLPCQISYYRDWCSGNLLERKVAANKIVELCEKALGG